HGAQIINLSLSGPPDVLLGKLIDIAKARRIAVVAAWASDRPDGGFPASHAGVIAVADEASPAPSGVYGAPGRDVPATAVGGHGALVSAASFAAAEVSGLLALMREHAASPVLILVIGKPGDTIDACASLIGRVADCACACAPPEASAIARR